MYNYKIAAVSIYTNSYLLACTQELGFNRSWGFLGGELSKISYEDTSSMEPEFNANLKGDIGIAFDQYHHLGMIDETYFALIMVEEFSGFNSDRWNPVAWWTEEEALELNLDAATRLFMHSEVQIGDIFSKSGGYKNVKAEKQKEIHR